MKNIPYEKMVTVTPVELCILTRPWNVLDEVLSAIQTACPKNPFVNVTPLPFEKFLNCDKEFPAVSVMLWIRY
jgi:hypothetical protein